MVHVSAELRATKSEAKAVATSDFVSLRVAENKSVGGMGAGGVS